MTTYDLMLKVKDILEGNGYSTKSAKLVNLRDYENHASADKGGKSYWKPVQGYNFNDLFGYVITFEVVHRHNGTEENKSVDISIYEYESSYGHRIAKERVNTNMSDRQINNRVKKIMDIFEAL